LFFTLFGGGHWRAVSPSKAYCRRYSRATTCAAVSIHDILSGAAADLSDAAIAVNVRQCARYRDETAIPFARECSNGALDLAGVAHIGRA
jgi:hypothetical protein